MRKIILSLAFISMLVFTGCATSTNSQNIPNIKKEALIKQEIINIIDNVGTLADAKDWEKLKTLFDKKVLLDYSSMTKQPAETISNDEIMKRWSGFLPGFDYTSHKNINQSVNIINNNQAKANSDVKATHYIKGAKDGEFWVVNGSYDYTLNKIDGQWKVAYMKLNFKDTEGNNDLPNLALQRAKNSAK